MLNVCNRASVNQCSLVNQSSQLVFSEQLFLWIHLPRSSRLSNCTKFALNHLETVKLLPAAMDLRVRQEGARSPDSPGMCFSPRAHGSRVEQEMTDSSCLLQYLLSGCVLCSPPQRLWLPWMKLRERKSWPLTLKEERLPAPASSVSAKLLS